MTTPTDDDLRRAREWLANHQNHAPGGAHLLASIAELLAEVDRLRTEAEAGRSINIDAHMEADMAESAWRDAIEENDRLRAELAEARALEKRGAVIHITEGPSVFKMTRDTWRIAWNDRDLMDTTGLKCALHIALTCKTIDAARAGGKSSAPSHERCVVCGVNWVDSAGGYDTCKSCLSSQ